MRNSPDDVLVKMLEMLSFISCTFLPPDKLKPYVLSFLKEIAKGDNNKAMGPGYAKDTIYRMLRMDKNKVTRRFIPVIEFELERVLKRSPILVSIGFPGGNQKKLAIDSCTSFKEVQELLLDKLGVPGASGYAIYKKISKVYQKVLNPNDNICDTVATMKAYEESLKSKISFEFILRKRIFLLTEPPLDEQERILLYQQAFTDILEGSLPCSTFDLAKLGSLKVDYFCNF